MTKESKDKEKVNQTMRRGDICRLDRNTVPDAEKNAVMPMMDDSSMPLRKCCLNFCPGNEGSECVQY